MQTNKCHLFVGEDKYMTCIIPQDMGGAHMPAYIDDDAGLSAAVARVWMSEDQLDELPAGVLAGTTAVGIHMSGAAPQKAIDLMLQKDDTAEIFYIWSYQVIKLGVDLAIYEVMLATEQQWWSSQRIDYRENILTEDKRDIVGTEKSWSTMVAEILALVGITATNNVTINDYRPHIIRYDGMKPVEALRRVLDPMGAALCHNIYDDTWTVERPTDFTLPAGMENVLLNGDKDASRTPIASVYPSSIEVNFPDLEAGLDDDRYHVETIAAPDPTLVKTPDDVATIYAGNHFQLPCAKMYTDDLAGIAQEMADGFYGNAEVVPRSYHIAGHVIASTTVNPASSRRVEYSCEGLVTYIAIKPVDFLTSHESAYQHEVMTGTRLYPHHGGFDIEGPILVWVELTANTAGNNTGNPYMAKKIERIAAPPYVQDSPNGETYDTVINIRETNNPAGTGVIFSASGVNTATNPLPGTVEFIPLPVGFRTMARIEGCLVTIDAPTTFDGAC